MRNIIILFFAVVLITTGRPSSSFAKGACARGFAKSAIALKKDPQCKKEVTHTLRSIRNAIQKCRGFRTERRLCRQAQSKAKKECRKEKKNCKKACKKRKAGKQRRACRKACREEKRRCKKSARQQKRLCKQLAKHKKAFEKCKNARSLIMGSLTGTRLSCKMHYISAIKACGKGAVSTTFSWIDDASSFFFGK